MFLILLMLLSLEWVPFHAATPPGMQCSFSSVVSFVFYTYAVACPRAYVIGNDNNSSCYKLVRSSASYYFANNECGKDGGTLAEIKDSAEDRYIWYMKIIPAMICFLF